MLNAEVFGAIVFALVSGFALGLWVASIRQRRRQVTYEVDPPAFTFHPDSPVGRINQAFDDFGKRLTGALTERPVKGLDHMNVPPPRGSTKTTDAEPEDYDG